MCKACNLSYLILGSDYQVSGRNFKSIQMLRSE